jgi:nucleotidyltransferase/DNA polymerase involved in DNA repair
MPQRHTLRPGLDLRAPSLAFLQQHFGKIGSYFYWAARGIDERPVRADWIRKSIGAENTFPADLFTYEVARDALQEIIDKVWGTASAPISGAALSPSRSSSQTSSRSREATPLRRRSGREANSNGSAVYCSNPYFL